MNTIHFHIKQCLFLTILTGVMLLSTNPATAQDSLAKASTFSPNVVFPPTGPPAVATVSGPSTIPQGTVSSNYTETGLTTGSYSSWTWSLTNSAAGTVSIGAGSQLVTITWNPSFAGNVGIQFSATNEFGTTPGRSQTTTVYIKPVISPAALSINYNTKPTLSMTSAVDAHVFYQWQSSPNGSSWSDITGANSTTYTPASGLTATTYYRLTGVADDISPFYTSISNTSAVTVYPQLIAGAVLSGLGDQTVYYNHGAAVGCQPPSGGKGVGSYSYIWQSSPTGAAGSWANVPGAAPATSISTPVLKTKTYFHVIQSSNGVNVTGPTITVSVYPQIVAGTLSPVTQTINYNTPAATITSQAAAGGNGTFTYMWQSSTNGTSFTDNGITDLTCEAGTLTATHYYHLVCTAPNGDKDTSATATVTVYPQLVSGAVTLGSTTVYYGHPATITYAAATGGKGAGSYTYKWESSANGTTWSPIAGTTTALTTPALTAKTYYHLISSSNGVSVTGATVTISVYAQIQAGTIPVLTQAINYGGSATVTGNTATGGNGAFTYRWQGSTNGTAFTDNGITDLTCETGTLTATHYYRVIVTAPNSDKDTSAMATVSVYPQLVSGAVTLGSTTIYYNHTATIAYGAATGGKGAGSYTYTWESSANGTTWSPITGTATTLTTPALKATTYFHMKSWSNGASVTGATVTIKVYGQVQAGTIPVLTQAINYGGSATVTGNVATGGNGSFTYQWQISTNGTSWANINITDLSCETGALTATRYYHVICMAPNSDKDTSSMATVTVYPQLVAGSITPASQAIPFNTKPDTLASAPTGGKGTYTYQWQSSADNITFGNISTATAATYIPGILAATTYYRVLVNSNGATAYTIPATVIVTDCRVMGTAPTASMNYVISSSFRTPGITRVSGVSQLAGMTDCDVSQTIQYIDGLGRPIQTVQVKGSPGYNDIVQPAAYDQFGREATKYLPYTLTTGTSDGSYKLNALTGQSLFYNPTGSATLTQQPNGVVNTSYPMAGTRFEPSPLNRVVEQGAPGAAWQLSTSGVTGSGHTVRIAYGINVANEVIQWKVNSTGNGLTGGATHYGTGTLYTTTTTDENGFSAIEYKDMDGRVVCKKAQLTPAAGSYVATYYVYNDLNNLSYVIPPQPTGAAYPVSILETDAVFTSLIYGYHYDERSRLTEKKIPGKGWEFMVYNRINQVIFSQDAVQRSQSPQVWTYIKYDAQGRVAITGIWSSGTLAGSTPDPNIASPSHVLAQWLINWAVNNLPVLWVSKDSTQPTGYSIIDPQGPVLTTNYYDDYNGIPGMPPAFLPPAGASNMTTGLPTAAKAAVLSPDGSISTNMLSTSIYYDGFGRNIKTFQQHYLGGVFSTNNYDEISSSYDFTGTDTMTVRKHHTAAASGGIALTVTNNYDYDHAGRKINTWEQINSGTNVLLSKAIYNEIGQLNTRRLHSANSGSSFLQDVGYTYTERGWLSKSIAPLFEEMLQYNIVNGVSGVTPVAQYNGNIASQSWGSGATPNTATFLYTYDPLNRLTSGSATTGYKEKSISYDQTGNILVLQRYWANTLIDDLRYNYLDGSGNYTHQLQSITDLTTSDQGVKSGSNQAYSYDGNGSMKTDNSKALAVTYNMLSLPALNTVTGGTISYTYDATGRKLRKVSALGTGSTTDYISGIQYNGTAIDFVQTEQGRVLNPTTTPNYEYSLTDHLGNNRVTFDSSTGGTAAVQTDDYMPFGMDIPQGIVPSQPNKYLYNNKELQDGLGSYDYGARFYDPVIARWNTIDPLAEMHTDLTPYNYVMNNPLLYGDEFGMDTTKVHQLKEVKITATKPKKENNEDAVGTNLYHHSYHPAPLPPCNCPLFKQAATFTAINLTLYALTDGLGKYFSKLKFLRGEGGVLADEVSTIGPQKWIKIMNKSHAWDKVATSQGDIETILSNTLEKGANMPYGNTGLMSKVMYQNGEIVQVVTTQVNGRTVVSNAWVITDPAYKLQALRVVSNIQNY